MLKSRALWAAIGFIAFVLMGFSWAYASPPGSAANDRATLAAIWCAWGDSESCEPVPDDIAAALTKQEDPAPQVYVPTWIAGSGCFADSRDKDARCTLLLSSAIAPIELTPQMEHPTGFHLTMRALVGPDPARSIVLMRFLNVLIAGLLVGLAAFVTRPVTRRAMLTAWALVLAPVGIFFIASTSPQSWVLAGTGTFWAFLTTVLQGAQSRTRQWLATAGALLAGGMALAASPDAGVILALSGVVAVLLAWPRLSRRTSAAQRAGVIALTAVGAIALIAITWTSRVGFGADATPLVFPPGDPTRGQPNAVIKAVLEVPSFISGMLGAQPPVWSQRMEDFNFMMPGFTWPGFSYGLGHAEHLLPSLVGVFLIAAVGGAALWGFMSYTWRKVIAFALVFIVFVAAMMFRRSVVEFRLYADPLLPQEYWPYLLLAVGVALVVFPARRRLWIGAQIGLLIFLIATAQSVALRGTLARYMFGQTHSYTNLVDEPKWWWPSGPQADHVWLLGTVAGLALYLIVFIMTNRARREMNPSGQAAAQSLSQESASTV